jgi:hypothetical protein
MINKLDLMNNIHEQRNLISFLKDLLHHCKRLLRWESHLPRTECRQMSTRDRNQSVPESTQWHSCTSGYRECRGSRCPSARCGGPKTRCQCQRSPGTRCEQRHPHQDRSFVSVSTTSVKFKNEVRAYFRRAPLFHSSGDCPTNPAPLAH